MDIRTRKLIGVLATLTFLTVYSLVAMAIGGQFVTGKGKLFEFLFFVVAGVAWLPVVMAVIKWMSRPDP